MKSNSKRPIGVRALGAVSSLVIVFGVVYIVFAGINLASSLILLSAFGGLAGPAIVMGDSVVECITGIFEMFIEGIMAVFEFIGNLFGSMFG